MTVATYRRYYQEHKEVIDARNAKWRTTDKCREYKREYAKKWRLKQRQLKEQFGS